MVNAPRRRWQLPAASFLPRYSREVSATPMTMGRDEVYSDLAIPPGETLADEIEARGMTQTELAAEYRMFGDELRLTIYAAHAPEVG